MEVGYARCGILFGVLMLMDGALRNDWIGLVRVER